MASELVIPRELAPGEVLVLRVDSIPVVLAGGPSDAGWQRLTFCRAESGGYVWTNDDGGGWSGVWSCRPGGVPYPSLSEAVWAALNPALWGDGSSSGLIGEYSGRYWNSQGELVGAAD